MNNVAVKFGLFSVPPTFCICCVPPIYKNIVYFVRKTRGYPDDDYTGRFISLHWQLSPTQMKCTSDASNFTYILFELPT